MSTEQQIIDSVHLPPNIDPLKATLAYGRRALGRLNEELRSPELLTRQRATRALCDLMHDHEYIADAIKRGLVQSLDRLLDDPDVTVRMKATECLFVMSQHSVARQAFLECGIITHLSKLFDDEVELCRLMAQHAIEMVSETPIGAQGIVEAKLVPKLISKLTDESEPIKELVLDTLHFCMWVDTEDALGANAMDVFTSLLGHLKPSIRTKAARDIGDLSAPLAGKNRAVEGDTVPRLVQLLTHAEPPSVRAAAAGALMTIAITTKGKYTAIKANAIPPLLALVDDQDSEVRANALKALTCLSEAPEGRKALLPTVSMIAKHMDDQVPAVAKHATIAHRVITWKP